MAKIITFTKVRLENGWLGNMSPHPITVNAQTWRTGEALFQAWRFHRDDPVRKEIWAAKSPMAAKMIAKKNIARTIVVPRSDADLANMEILLRLKLAQHPVLHTLLLDTGEAILIEDVTARPSESGLFWGAMRVADNTWEGHNHLGRTWMRVRADQ